MNNTETRYLGGECCQKMAKERKRKKKSERAEERGTARPEVTVKCEQLENNLNSRRFAISCREQSDLAERAEAFNDTSTREMINYQEQTTWAAVL